MRNFNFKPLFFLLIMGFSVTTCFSAPETLNKADIKKELLQGQSPVTEFLTKVSGELNQNMEKAISEGKVSPQDRDSVTKALKEFTGSIFTEAEKLRKELKEIEFRLQLDMEIINLAIQISDTQMVNTLINNWKGDVREILILTAAQRFQMMKIDFNKEFEAMLKECKESKDPTVVAAVDKFLNQFFRNPAGMPFPAFPKGMKTTDGKELSLERFKGKVLLVDFWATWCPPCRAEIPNLVKAYNEFKDKGFEIIGISFDKSRDDFDSYLTENKMEWPQYFDGKGWENEVGPTYGIQSIPTMYLLDKEGKVITTELRGGKLEEELAKQLK